MKKLESFYQLAKLDEKTEVERAYYLAYFHLKENSTEYFTAAQARQWMTELSLAAPNVSRLAGKLASDSNVIRGNSIGSFKLHRNFIKACEGAFPTLGKKSQEVEDIGTLIPESLYSRTPGYIQSISKQINASYEHNIFDGCAVLMRRLEEILLILSYEHLNLGSEIKDANGNYLMLEGIVKHASNSSKLNLSRNGKKTIETIRELGNYSAHKITYTCKREYISERINEFRALIDELLHKAGLKV